MADCELRLALIAGPMYDALYQTLAVFTKDTGIQVNVGFHGVHSELNAHLASLSAVPYHLISTHTKYAPSQRRFLAPLDEDGLEDFYPPVLEMARIDRGLYGLPRNIDVKLLHYRNDVVRSVPQTWDELRESARTLSESNFYGFVFPGKDSGLFGMFYELAEMGGAALFPEDNIPRLNQEGGRWALQIIRDLYQSGAAPREIVEWQYDEAHTCFRDGHAAMICDWPGYYAAYRADESRVRGRFEVARMPAGPLGVHKVYSGAHTFALTKLGKEHQAAALLLRFLTSPEQQIKEAKRGAVPVRSSVMSEIRGQDSRRWKLLEQVISSDTLIPPRLAYYPEIEDILWRSVRSAMSDEIGIESALSEMESRIISCHQRNTLAEEQHAS